MSEANVFIIINLGCEMLYVIDQRLEAQNIDIDKSIQVMRDITTLLLEPKFIQRLMIINKSSATAASSNTKLITPDHCKFILKDIACSSLMKLDDTSMQKLWDLVTMLFKWQLFTTKNQSHLLIDITFRHLDGIAKIHPELKKTILVDYIKNLILDYWNSYQLQSQNQIYTTIIQWLNEMYVKISILIRLGFQNVEGKFLQNVNEEYFKDFCNNAGENIYKHCSELDKLENEMKHDNIIQSGSASSSSGYNKFDSFANQLDIKIDEITNDKTQNISTNTDERNDILRDFIFNNLLDESDKTSDNSNNEKNQQQEKDQFVKVDTVHNTSQMKYAWQQKFMEGGSAKNLEALLHQKF